MFSLATIRSTTIYYESVPVPAVRATAHRVEDLGRSRSRAVSEPLAIGRSDAHAAEAEAVSPW